MKTAILPLELAACRVRRLREQDLTAFQAYRCDPQIGRYQGWQAQSDAQALAFLQEMAAAPLLTPGAWLQLGIADAASDVLLGDLGLFLAADGLSAEIGFSLARAAQGRGIATAAVRAACALLFAHTQAQQIAGIADARNLPSIRLLQRIGMQFVREEACVFRGERCIEAHYVLARPASGCVI
ncbi:GNAT family N-acetyltransferase [Massilia sp. W12]|uniref:GNAT family N-acetyltransferase n=1 Tax=Massilia sp. W12 TaxID=3126507 RepID=UPI0030D1A03A